MIKDGIPRSPFYLPRVVPPIADVPNQFASMLYFTVSHANLALRSTL